jgi:hypothetical protein
MVLFVVVFSSFSIDRKYLPSSYTLKKWNQSMIRSKLDINSNQRLIFGNIGEIKRAVWIPAL